MVSYRVVITTRKVTHTLLPIFPQCHDAIAGPLETFNTGWALSGLTVSPPVLRQLSDRLLSEAYAENTELQTSILFSGQYLPFTQFGPWVNGFTEFELVDHLIGFFFKKGETKKGNTANP